MELKKIEVLNELSGKVVSCVCINYENFIKDSDDMVIPRYREFKCNPKNQFNKKAQEVLTEAIYEEHFLPSLYFVRLNKKQTICNSQLDYTFELLNKAFLERDDVRKNEISPEVLEVCLSSENDYVMNYIGMNR